MRLTEAERLAVMKDRDENRPCRTCEYNMSRHRRKKNDLGCVHSNQCNYDHSKGWTPIQSESYFYEEEEEE